MEVKLIVLVVLIGALGRVVEAQQAAAALTTTVNRTGCGSTKLCVSNELNCDPAGSSSCFFSSFQVTNQTLQVELSGSNSGYVALGLNLLSQTGSNSVGFVCLKNTTDNTRVLFQTVYRDTTNINPVNVDTVSNIQGAIRNQSVIQCTFTLTGNITITNSTTTANLNITANLIVKNGTIVTIYRGTVTETTMGPYIKMYDSQAALSLNDPLSYSATSQIGLNITRTGCGSTKLCVLNELNCDPVGSSSCFFSSFQVTNQMLQVELSGPTSGYVALGLNLMNQTGNNSVGIACFKNPVDNTRVLFQMFYGDTTNINPVDVATVSNIKDAITNQNIIQCTFTLTENITITNTSTNLNITANLTMKNGTIVTIYRGTVTETTPGFPIKMYDSQAALSLNDPLSNSATSQTGLNITRTGCGSTKLCVSSKIQCVPGTSGCFFTSIQRNNQTNQTMFFELSGTTSGYVAVGLKKQNTTVVFVCGNNKTGGSFFFQTSTKNGSSLIPANVATVYSIQGEVTQKQSLDVVQCVFNTSTAFNITTKADSPPNYSISVANGTTSGTQLGDPSTLIETKELDLGVPVDLSSAPTTIISVWTHVLAVLLSVVTLHVL